MLGILRSLFMVAAAAAVIGGGTYSYFSASDTAGGTLSAGTLSVDLLNQNTPDPLSFHVTGMVPGGTTLVNFDVQNGGTANIPVNLRGLATGTWDISIPSPDPNLIKVTQVERWNGSAWEVLVNSPSGITGVFYYSPTGTDAALYTIAAGDKAQFRLTVKLDEAAGDKYQGKTFDAILAVQTKQATAPTWPASVDTGF
ncbi:MAG: TasA family protein [Candidatus Moranbacteria bacterium]|nr:TasA family protein [Candidatus Moranbacteria bacterium]